jgi:Gram-negative bacterial TonB protein C-terminal
MKIWLWAGLPALALIFVTSCYAQDAPAATSADAQGGVVLVKLAPPVYPAIARAARVSGDVELNVRVRPDGGVDSAEAMSGPPLLYRAAQESAKGSQFECRKCFETTSYKLIYTFQLNPLRDCVVGENGEYKDPGPQKAPQVTQSDNRITLIDDPPCSEKCVILGKRVRTARCLWLWHCGSTTPF